ncbi:putative uncharacterized protein DDB_G0289963 [Linepithema humile]|uniref:putative uncharacterized protein DDB_G0289963 n=1 Tax=Linepithema humile TaxID=83485 RepID=UPI000623A2E9|nr:PREDICTED: GATA zinc finger domain-containing protein 4-like [Linepithema humile]
MDHTERNRKLTRMRVKRFRAIRKQDKNYSISKPSTSTVSKKRCLSMENFDTNKSSDKNQENCQMPYISRSANEENINEVDSSVGYYPNMDISNDNNDDDISNNNNDDDISNDNNDDDINNDNNDNDEDDVEINCSEHDQHSDDDQYSNDNQYSDEDIEDFNEIEALREWAIKYNIKHTHLDSLLQILRKKMLPELPKSPKTFLKTTSAEYEIKQLKVFKKVSNVKTIKKKGESKARNVDILFRKNFLFLNRICFGQYYDHPQYI